MTARRCRPPSSSSSASRWCFRKLDIPTPGPGQILVKTEACGVCHTDLHAATRRLAGEAHAAVHSRPRGHRPGRRRRRRRDDREGGRPGRRALALLGLRSLRVLPDGLGDGVRRGAVRRLYQERRLCGVHPRRPELRRPYPGRSWRQGGRAHSSAPASPPTRASRRPRRRPGEWIVISGVRRPRASGDSICQGHGTAGLRGRYR